MCRPASTIPLRGARGRSPPVHAGLRVRHNEAPCRVFSTASYVDSARTAVNYVGRCQTGLLNVAYVMRVSAAEPRKRGRPPQRLEYTSTFSGSCAVIVSQTVQRRSKSTYCSKHGRTKWHVHIRLAEWIKVREINCARTHIPISQQRLKLLR